MGQASRLCFHKLSRAALAHDRSSPPSRGDRPPRTFCVQGLGAEFPLRRASSRPDRSRSRRPFRQAGAGSRAGPRRSDPRLAACRRPRHGDRDGSSLPARACRTGRGVSGTAAGDRRRCAEAGSCRIDGRRAFRRPVEPALQCGHRAVRSLAGRGTLAAPVDQPHTDVPAGGRPADCGPTRRFCLRPAPKHTGGWPCWPSGAVRQSWR